jgi:hypothetical protein
MCFFIKAYILIKLFGPSNCSWFGMLLCDQPIDLMGYIFSNVSISETHDNLQCDLGSFAFIVVKFYVLYKHTCPLIALPPIFAWVGWYCVHHKCGLHFNWYYHYQSHLNKFRTISFFKECLQGLQPKQKMNYFTTNSLGCVCPCHSGIWVFI